MSIELVTGYKGEPHISSADVSNLLQGIIGENIVVLNVGNKMAANPISANEIDIEDGGAVFQGKHFVIPAGDIEPCIIQNGSQGTYRRDLIVAHYVKSLETSVESVEIKVLKGTEAQTKNAATTPTYITGNIWEGATVVEAPLYEVLLNGINIESITPKYDVMKSAEETKADINQLNADLSETNSNLSDIIELNDFIDLSTKDSNAQVSFNAHRQGRILHARISVTSTIAAPSGGIAIGTLASNYFPVNEGRPVFPCVNNNTAQPQGSIYINGGSGNVSRIYGTQANVGYICEVMWFI